MSKLRQERQRLSQEANLSYVRNDFSPTDMVPVYSPRSTMWPCLSLTVQPALPQLSC